MPPPRSGLPDTATSRRQAGTSGAPTRSSRSCTRSASADDRGKAGSGAGDSRAARPRYGWTVVFAVAVLFVVFGSVGEVRVTEAVFVIVPLVVGFTTRVIVTDAPLAIVPTVHATAFFDGLSVQDPCVVVVAP